mmetsp:Transcript_1535/g.3182  ORF Transcript_1535/g.3182 Transcript_1535/m.3182 type:complete len:206 (+) Transcript_1535:443-1060(+)
MAVAAAASCCPASPATCSAAAAKGRSSSSTVVAMATTSRQDWPLCTARRCLSSSFRRDRGRRLDGRAGCGKRTSSSGWSTSARRPTTRICPTGACTRRAASPRRRLRTGGAAGGTSRYARRTARRSRSGSRWPCRGPRRASSHSPRSTSRPTTSARRRRCKTSTTRREIPASCGSSCSCGTQSCEPFRNGQCSRLAGAGTRISTL